MQAALDLADQGFKVYLVEKETAIGGHMARLDKTFPTNDCAMCNLSPKMVDTGRHLNIDILTNTQVLEVTGKAGDFTARLLRKPRYIDVSRCIGCGDCAEVCPVSVPDQYESGLKERKAAYRLYSQAVPAAYAIDKLGVAPCRDGCPAGQRAQGYIALIAQGRYREALRVIKEDNPFPSVCGRTCHHPCEGKCTRALVDQAVGIMSLKRFVVDYALAYGRDQVEPAARTRPEWVAIVGAGPAGLTAAHDLVKLGYGVTVYEALPVAGGMMRVGIPAHRLPKGVLQQDIDDILALGVVLKTNSPVRDPVRLLEEGYQAVCLATGISSRDQTIGFEGEEVEGVIPAATFLRKINLGEPVTVGARVAVVGGGITALDAAAVARRLGAEQVHLLLDRPRGEIPAYQWEVAAVEAEGINLYEHTCAIKIIADNGRVSGLEYAQTGEGMALDSRGQRRPNIKAGTEAILEVDTIIGTSGQYSDLSFLDDHYSELAGDKKTLASSIPGLFIVGGRKTGASFIIEAVALGHRVAKSIDSYLQGGRPDQPEVTALPVVKFNRQELAQKVQAGEIKLTSRIEPALLPMAERVTSFREVVLGLTERQARMEAARCLQCGICSECLACVYACGVEAIDHNMVAGEQKVNVGAVILAPGYQAYNAALAEEYGFGRYPNVLTALQFERLLSASGPTMGHIRRPSDHQPPQRIAFLQCIGSRDQSHDYCSAVCCMYATKEAMIAREHQTGLDVHIFMMDMRAFSKGYWSYFERARDRYGIQYHRTRVSAIQEDPQTHNLLLQYGPERQIADEANANLPITAEFDLVVLSVGMEISTSVRDLGRRLGIELDEYGFCSERSNGESDIPRFNPVETTRPGIYAVGPFREPKDIPEAVVEASSAAAAAAGLLAPARYTLSVQREYPAEREVRGEEARVGVFVCSCGSNIGGYLDVASVTSYAGALPNVVHSEWNLYTCSQEGIRLITEQVQAKSLNRVVVASCSPLTHQALFQDSIRAAGLNPHLFEMANIRNQCSWVHSDDREIATQKAKELIRMSVARACLLEPQQMVSVPVQATALVVGGGAAGMVAALSLADQGFPVHLVEREAELGGNLRRITTGFDGQDLQSFLNQLVNQVRSKKGITLHLESRVVKTSGFLGNFTSTLQGPDEDKWEVRHGVTILATGAVEYRGPDYGYGSIPSILTQQELETCLAVWEEAAGKDRREDGGRMGELTPSVPRRTVPVSVLMILCVGPAEHYCSRICCSVALKNALRLKALFPQMEVTVLFKDMRTYGFKERLFEASRAQGVIFLRYDAEHPPIVEREDRHNQASLAVQAWDSALRRRVALFPDLVVLGMPVVPEPSSKALAALFKVSTDADGFFFEAHVKLRPVDFATSGIFMAGMAHYPKLLEETIIQAKAAAARAARVLSQDYLTAGGRVAVVDQDQCTGCLTCVRICPFNVPKIKADLSGAGGILGSAYIEPAICQGCGSCAAECPARAIQLTNYTDAQLKAKVGALLQPEAVR